MFTADVGTPCIWAARYLRMNGRRRLIGSFNHGSMANALPQAIGAQASQPARQVVTLSGDGGVAMLLGELITLRQLQLPVKVVVFNNGALSFVELEMKAAGIVTYGTDLDNPDFAAIARAVGLFGVRVDKAGELDDALRAAFGHDGPALVDVRTDRSELRCRPRSPTARSRASRCMPPGPSCPGTVRSSSSWPSRTCATLRSNGRAPAPARRAVVSVIEEVLAGYDQFQAAQEAFYKDLHEHPELSHAEHRTAQRVAGQLHDNGFTVHDGIGGTGVVGVLPNGDGPTVLLRCELDALPVREDTGAPYASTVTVRDAGGHEVPVSHACGHDMHMACMIGMAKLMADHRDRWNGTLMPLFQPAEETADGAQGMVDDGLFQKSRSPMSPWPSICCPASPGPSVPAPVRSWPPPTP